MIIRNQVAAVVIGRNESRRLSVTLPAIMAQVDRIIYVDSGSTDNSVTIAQNLGITVHNLDPNTPFSAARARKEGFEQLAKDGEIPEFVQFMDGDTRFLPDWITAGKAELQAHEHLGLVTGVQSEEFPDASVYNGLCDFEWHRDLGDIQTCGGNMMVRSSAYMEAGAFNPTVIAAEDDEMCIRLRKAGWTLRRIDVPMSFHDANMYRFSQWWRRAVRSGHGFAQVGYIHPDFFVAERKRVWMYGFVLPLLLLIGLLDSWLFTEFIVLLYLLSYAKTVRGLMKANMPLGEAMHQSLFLSLSKFPNAKGFLQFHLRRIRRKAIEIIEYK